MTKPKPRGLTFTPGNHTYRIDGAHVPSVTTILGVLNKPALTKWAAKSVAEWVADHPDMIEQLYAMGRGPMVAALKEVPWQARDTAATRGTDFHTLAEQITNGKEVDVPEHLVPLVESALAFMDDWQIVPVLTEVSVGSREHRYAGRLDLVADHKYGPRAVMDWKSGKAIYAQTAFQLAAYAGAEFHGERGNEHPMADLGIEAAYGVHIRADGYTVYPLTFGPAVFDEFLTIRAAFDINRTANGDWKTPGSGYVGLPITQPDEDTP